MSEKDALAYTILRELYDCIGDSDREYIEHDKETIAAKLVQIFDLSNDAAEDILNSVLATIGAPLFSSTVRIPRWIGNILPEDRMPSCLSPVKDVKAPASINPFRTADSSIIPLLRYAIDSKTPLCLRVESQDISDMPIVQCMLSRRGIPAFILYRDYYGSDDIMSAALYAYHQGGILLTPDPIRSISELTVKISITERFRLRIGGFKTKEEDDNEDEDGFATSETDDERKILNMDGILVVDMPISYLSGNAMEEACKSIFGEGGSAVCRIASEHGVRPDRLQPFHRMISEILGKGDRTALSQLISSFRAADKDGSHASVMLPEKYDASILNMDTPIRIVKQMAQKASLEKRAFRILLVGPSGSGKSALAHYLASVLGIPLSPKSAADVFFKNFGDSEKAVPMIFKEAQKERALLLFDEAESVLGIKASPTTPGGKTYNQITNLFLQSMEAYQGVMVCTTNYLDYIEPACIRRFHRVINVGYPDEVGLHRLLSANFPDITIQENEIADLAALEAIGPGDIASVKETSEYMNSDDVTAAFILKSLREAAAARTGHKEKRPIGFR